MNYIKIYITLLILVLSISSNPVDLLSTGFSSWIALGEKNTESVDSRSVYYFNKIYLNNYLTLGPIKGYVGIPLQIVAQRVWSESEMQRVDTSGIRLGDLNIWIGKKVKFIEPRIGIKLPLFYPKDNIWYGSGNIKIQAGIGLNANVRDDNLLSNSGEIMFNIVVVDWTNSDNVKNAHAYNGSFTLLPSYKLSLKPNDKIKVGLEILGSFSRTFWTWNNTNGDDERDDNEIELSASIVPNIYSEIFIKDKLALSTKAGFGPSFKKGPENNTFKRTGSSVNLSLGVNLYP